MFPGWSYCEETSNRQRGWFCCTQLFFYTCPWQTAVPKTCPGLCQPISDISFALHITHLACAAQDRALGPVLPAGKGQSGLLGKMRTPVQHLQTQWNGEVFFLPNLRTCWDTCGVSVREEKQNWVSHYTGFQLYLGTTITWEALPTACSK